MSDPVYAAARALRDAAKTFALPVDLYVEGEALQRWEQANPGKHAHDESPDMDWELESWAILARALLGAKP